MRTGRSESSSRNQWWYRDPKGNVQGPYPAQALLDWRVKGYFTDSIEVCKVNQDLEQVWLPLGRAWGEVVAQAKAAAGEAFKYAPGGFSKPAGNDPSRHHDRHGQWNDPKSTASEGGWEYQDPAGRLQGPFTADNILAWYLGGFFPRNLFMRKLEKGKCSPWLPLSDALPYLQREAGPLKAAAAVNVPRPPSAPAGQVPAPPAPPPPPSAPKSSQQLPAVSAPSPGKAGTPSPPSSNPPTDSATSATNGTAEPAGSSAAASPAAAASSARSSSSGIYIPPPARARMSQSGSGDAPSSSLPSVTSPNGDAPAANGDAGHHAADVPSAPLPPGLGIKPGQTQRKQLNTSAAPFVPRQSMRSAPLPPGLVPPGLDRRVVHHPGQEPPPPPRRDGMDRNGRVMMPQQAQGGRGAYQQQQRRSVDGARGPQRSVDDMSGPPPGFEHSERAQRRLQRQGSGSAAGAAGAGSKEGEKQAKQQRPKPQQPQAQLQQQQQQQPEGEAKREPPVQPEQAMAMASNLLHNLSFKPPKRVISLAEQPPLEEQIAGQTGQLSKLAAESSSTTLAAGSAQPLKGKPNEAETIALFSSFTTDNEQPLLWYLCKAGTEFAKGPFLKVEMMKRFYDGRIKHNDLVAGVRADAGKVLPTVQFMRPFKLLITHIARGHSYLAITKEHLEQGPLPAEHGGWVPFAVLRSGAAAAATADAKSPSADSASTASSSPTDTQQKPAAKRGASQPLDGSSLGPLAVLIDDEEEDPMSPAAARRVKAATTEPAGSITSTDLLSPQSSIASDLTGAGVPLYGPVRATADSDTDSDSSDPPVLPVDYAGEVASLPLAPLRMEAMERQDSHSSLVGGLSIGSSDMLPAVLELTESQDGDGSSYAGDGSVSEPLPWQISGPTVSPRSRALALSAGPKECVTVSVRKLATAWESVAKDDEDEYEVTESGERVLVRSASSAGRSEPVPVPRIRILPPETTGWWWYIDHHDRIQGPFTGELIKVWRRKGFLTEDLPLYHSKKENDKPTILDFKPLVEFDKLP